MAFDMHDIRYPSNHRQRIGKRRTKFGLRPTPPEIEKRIDAELCEAFMATHPDGGMHPCARRTGWHWHGTFSVANLPDGVRSAIFEPKPSGTMSTFLENLAEASPW